MSGDSSTPNQTQKPMATVPNNSASPPHAPNDPTPVRETEVNRYMPDNVFARISFNPSGGTGAIHDRLDRLDIETDRLVDIFAGATSPATNPDTGPGTVMDLTTIMGLAPASDLGTVEDSATATDSATGTDWASTTATAAVSDSTIGTEQVANL